MKKIFMLLPLYAFVISAYVWIIAAFADNSESGTFFTVAFCLFLALFAINIVYGALLSALRKEGSSATLTSVFVVKIVLIPLFCLLFALGVFMALSIIMLPLFAGLWLFGIPMFVLLSYSLVLSTAVYAVGDMIRLYKQSPSANGLVLTAVCCVCQFIFVADVISLLVYLLLYRKIAPVKREIII